MTTIGMHQAPPARTSLGSGPSGPALALTGSEEYQRDADSAVFRRFLELRGRARGAIACVNSRFLFINSAAAGMVGYADRDHLWSWASIAVERGALAFEAVNLASGTFAVACAPIVLAEHPVGAELRLSAHTADHAGRQYGRARSATFGWDSLRESELGIARLVAEGLTNREIGARLFLSRHTIDFHLRQIYRKLAIGSRVELTRLLLERDADQRELSDDPAIALAGHP